MEDNSDDDEVDGDEIEVETAYDEAFSADLVEAFSYQEAYLGAFPVQVVDHSILEGVPKSLVAYSGIVVVFPFLHVLVYVKLSLMIQ